MDFHSFSFHSRTFVALRHMDDAKQNNQENVV